MTTKDILREQPVKFETAKMLKKIGFPQEGIGFSVYPMPLDSNGKPTVDSDDDIECYLPTQEQAMRWFRKAHQMYIEMYTPNSDYFLGWVWRKGVKGLIPIGYCCKSIMYESTVELCIEEACKYLIEKNNNK